MHKTTDCQVIPGNLDLQGEIVNILGRQGEFSVASVAKEVFMPRDLCYVL
jgi:hypothetical protein